MKKRAIQDLPFLVLLYFITPGTVKELLIIFKDLVNEKQRESPKSLVSGDAFNLAAPSCCRSSI